MLRYYYIPLKKCATQQELEDLFFKWHQKTYSNMEVVSISVERLPCWVLEYYEEPKNPQIEVKR